jgi:murein DD-endopeptidase MepM/ murein hydrolase activator NlpD
MTDLTPPLDRSRDRLVSAAALAGFLLSMLCGLAIAAGFVVLGNRLPTVAPPRLSTSEPAIAVLNPPPPPLSADFADATPPESPSGPYDVELRLQPGDTLDGVLADIGVPEDDRNGIAEALSDYLKRTRLAPGQAVRLTLQADVGAPDAPRVLSLLVRPRPEREYTVTRGADGDYSAAEKVYKVSPRVVRVAARRNGSLLESGVAAGAPAEALREFIKALSYGVDFQRELKQGQKFTLLIEQGVTTDGRVADPGRLLGGRLELAGRTETVIAYQPRHGARQFYTPDGYSVVRAFLRTPMDATHVTSGFGFRRHPILGYSALHQGVDFAAPTGTPILAAGAGRVARAGPYGGYGNYIELVHTPEIATAYGHMSRLAPGMRPGAQVRQGQVIGFVGSTGMATGPHLHYEFHRGGRPVNPLVQRASMRLRLAGQELAAFRKLVADYAGYFRSAPLAVPKGR